MTGNATASYLDRLDHTARSASIEEEDYRREAMERIKLLERQRAFAFRRLNLVRAVVASLAEAKGRGRKRPRMVRPRSCANSTGTARPSGSAK